jgi:hypothetical protein
MRREINSLAKSAGVVALSIDAGLLGGALRVAGAAHTYASHGHV